MSDMIWNGSYTLGDSQETQITAGTGIKVTTPAAGQIHISNDETVLYMNSTGTDSLSLSESIFNFERVRITYMGGALIPCEVERDISSSISIYNIAFPMFRPDNTYFVQFQCTTMTVSNNGSTVTFTDGKRLWIATTGSSSSGNDVQGIKCTKVVGINRISGGN